MTSCRPQELLIDVLAGMLAGLRVSILGSERHNPFTDVAASGSAEPRKAGAFFLGGSGV